ncbi:MAG TPA: M28 family peptidase [Oligoflexus sp.]|uniref:M20/M25/M40 family metallo-hydrolase n=1 Tax=Oligoflexus sp. TaxID=1971216 RepID=UPI002D808860|nr:M28 family peptidase [Oligoflexus sp.]HET9237200.1 M28 family peptidase [Oligoflexus sp.]
MKKLLWTLVLLPAWAEAITPLQFEAKNPKSKNIIWTDGVLQIKKPETRSAPKLGYAVLKARPHASLLQLLPKSYAIAPMPHSWDLNYYAVPLDSVTQLQDLAAWAHESTGMCGSIEFVNGSQLLTATTKIYPPIYGGRAVFEDAKPWLDMVSLAAMDQTIDTLAALPSRYFRHTQGELAHTTVRQIWEAQMVSARWTITEETQSLSNQKSVIARLEGSTKPDETIIVGAHLDSITGRGSTGNAPGADDDASGVAALTEILRVVESGQLTFDRSIELQAYAAEEPGLVGSKAIAAKYAADGRKIAGMFQIDMAYYSKEGAEGIVHLLQDYTSRDLRRQAIDWLRGYMGPVYKLGFLPRGSASDHKSFYDQGFPTVFPFEDPVDHNPYIHTLNDTRAQFDDGLLQRRITQLALLFTFHQGGLQSLAAAYDNLKKDLLPEDKKQGLKVALQTLDGQLYLAVSAPLDASTLEFCQIDDAAVPHCTEERAILDKDASNATRKFFYRTLAVDWTAGQKWRVIAYDASDDILAWRQFTLKNP